MEEVIGQSTPVPDVTHRVQSLPHSPNSTSSHDENGPSLETPIDYSMLNRKRRLINTFNDEEVAKNITKSVKLEYGSDGHSERSSPVEHSGDSSIISPHNTSDSKDESGFLPIDRSPVEFKPIVPDVQPQGFLPMSASGTAAALSLFIQAQQHHHHQQQQKVDLLQPLLRLSNFGQQSPLQLWQRSESLGLTNPTMELARVTQESRQKFEEIRETIFKQMSSTPTPTNPLDRRLSTPVISPPSSRESNPSEDLDTSQPPPNAHEKDSAYWERRRKNNEAAKRSRDARRAREQEVAVKAQFLEQENLQLKLEIAHLRAENAQLFGQFRQLQTST